MKVKTITCWVTTVLLSAMMAMSAVMYLTHNPHMAAAFVSLGYLNHLGTVHANALIVLAETSGRECLLRTAGYRVER